VLSTVGEHEDAFRLRYEVYGELGYLQRANGSGLEIDEFDSYAVPLGAFELASGALVGTLRWITRSRQPCHERVIRRLVADRGDAELVRQAFDPLPYPLPSLVSAQIRQQVQAFNVDGFAVGELSRTVVRPDHRGSGVSRVMLEVGVALASRDGPAVLVGGCLAEHVPMYARYGYVPLPGVAYFGSVGRIAHAVVSRTDVLPQPTRARVDGLLRALRSGAAECCLGTGRGVSVRCRLGPAAERG
jgi:hypothetical protein